jgi:glycosyltransferase involved in cell wall biosynthesis
MTSEESCAATILTREAGPNSPLKVFVVFFHPRTSVSAFGGAERRFAETLKVFCRDSCLDISVLEAAPSLLQESLPNLRKDVVSLSFHGKGWLGTYAEWALWSLKALFKGASPFVKSKPNVILVPNSTLPNLVSSRIFSRLFQVPACVIVHHIDAPFSGPTSGNSSLYNSYRSISYGALVSLSKTIAAYVTLPFLKKAKAIIAVSNFTAGSLANLGIPERRIRVSGNAVSLNFIKGVNPSYEKKTFDAVFVGRIAKEKGIFDLLKVWRNVVRVRRNARLLLIGTGLEYDLVKRRISELGLENRVFLRGRCEDADLYGLLKSSRLFVFPSLFEGWGMAVAEALACGLPVVAYDIPALREIFGKCGSMFLVPPKNVESMTSTVLDILSLNESEWAELSDCSERYSEQFTWDKIAEKDFESLKVFSETYV